MVFKYSIVILSTFLWILVKGDDQCHEKVIRHTQVCPGFDVRDYSEIVCDNLTAVESLDLSKYKWSDKVTIKNAAIPLVPRKIFGSIAKPYEYSVTGCSLDLKKQEEPAVAVTSVVKLQMNKCNVTILPEDAFKPFPNLNILDLSWNRLEKLENYAFRGLFRTKPQCPCRLVLSRNNISEIEPQAFGDAKYLSELLLDNNNLRVLDPQVFRNLTSLSNLILYHNKISTIDLKYSRGIVTLSFNRIKSLEGIGPGVTDLSLDYNSFRYLDKNAFNSSNLTHLSLINNNIKAIDKEAFSGLKNLEKLILDQNYIETLPEDTFKDLTKLLHLSIIKNRLRLENSTFNGLSNLLHLDLSRNPLIIRGDSFKGLEKLQTLIIIEAGLTEIPKDSFIHLTSLYVLNLNRNKLKQLNFDDFQTLTNLKHLLLNNNKIKTVDFGMMSAMSNLLLLDLSGNDLGTVNISNFKNNSKPLKKLIYNVKLTDCEWPMGSSECFLCNPRNISHKCRMMLKMNYRVNLTALFNSTC